MVTKEFWDKWTKYKMPYKVMVYICGCSYILITNKEKQILIKHSFCPVHKKAKNHVLLWCESCGLRIEAKPKAGYRQRRCFGCSKPFLLEYNRLNCKSNYQGKHKKTELQEINEEENLEERIPYLALARVIKGMKLDLPVVETPMLDKLLLRRDA